MMHKKDNLEPENWVPEFIVKHRYYIFLPPLFVCFLLAFEFYGIDALMKGFRMFRYVGF
jgi:hypothetical protein